MLLVVGRFPWPARRGDQVRAVQAAGALAAAGHRVTVLVPEPSGGGARAGGSGEETVPSGLPYRVETYGISRFASLRGAVRAGLRGLPLQAGLFHQPDLGRRLRELAPAYDAALLQLVRLAAHVPDLGETPFAVDLIDSLSLNFGRRARFDGAWKRPLLAMEAHALLRAERRVLEGAAVGLLVCERDRRWLAGRLPEAVAKRLRVVPLQVGAAASHAATSRATPSGAAPRPPLVAFTGNLGYFPSVDAVRWWVRDVWPALRAARPDLRLLLAGSRPAPAVRRAAEQPGVELEASPPDLAPLLASADVALAPMRAGSGVPVKVLEAWAAGVPVVASPWAADGAGASDGAELLVAASAAEWRRAVLRLLDDPALGRRLAAAGRARLAAHHSAAAVGAALEAALAPLLGAGIIAAVSATAVSVTAASASEDRPPR